MIKYQYISVLVDWGVSDSEKLNEYGDTGWRFVCYTNTIPVYALFEKRYKIVEE
jgi:hypothetical protein